MNMNIKIGLAMVFACLWTLAALYGLGIAAHKGSESYKNWSRQAEEFFYLRPGMGDKVLSRGQWDKYKEKMNNMDPEQLASFRLETHMALMGSFRRPAAPTLLPNEQMQADVRLDPGMKAFLTPIASRAAAGAASVGGSTPVTGTSGAASGSAGGTGSFVGVPTPTTGTSGTASGSIGGTNAFAGSSTPATGTSGTTSGSIGGTAAFGSFNTLPSASTVGAATAQSASQSLTAAAPAAAMAAAPSLTAVSPSALGGGSIPVTGSSGIVSGAAGGTSALGEFSTAGSSTVSTAGVVASTNLSPLSAALPQTPTLGSGSVLMQPWQGAVECAAPVQARAPASFNGVVTARDADTMFGVDPTTSTKRSVDSYDDSRGAIFHRDFDIGGGNRDMDRNYW